MVQLGGCVQCTEDFQCDDGSDCTFNTCDLSSYKCTYPDGMCGNQFCCGNRCQDCCTVDQCSGIGDPGGGGASILPDGGVDGLCTWLTCSDGKCIQETLFCQGYECCPGFGCYPPNMCPG